MHLRLLTLLAILTAIPAAFAIAPGIPPLHAIASLASTSAAPSLTLASAEEVTNASRDPLPVSSIATNRHVSADIHALANVH